MTTNNYLIQNLKCGGCATQIKSSLLKIEGVKSVRIDENESLVSIDVDETANEQTIVNTLSKLGYPLIDKANSLGKTAKSYVSCMIGRVKNLEI